MKLPASQRIYDRVQRLELPWNRYGLDPYGISQEHLAQFYTALVWLYEKYFDVSVYGIENIPTRGRVMLVGNHSGGVALDGAMVIASTFMEMEPPRLAQGMAEYFLNKLPFSSQWTSRLGHFTGLPEHAIRLLEDERMLMVFPEGARGTAKLYKDRNSLVRFGTGFMRIALQAKAPIVPLAFIGGGEAIPTVYNSELVGRLVGAPYVPFTPYVFPVPRPVDVQVYYGKPMIFEGDGNEEDEVIKGYVDTVKRQIGALIDFGVERREQRRLEVPEQLPVVEVEA